MGANGKLTKVEEHEALQYAEDLLAQLLKRSEVMKLLQAEYVIDATKAKKLAIKAENNLINAIEMGIAQRKAQHVSRLEALYRRCLAHKKFSTAERVLAQLGRVHGVEAPKVLQVTSTPQQLDPEFDNRSEQELDFYLNHGCWPEEQAAPKSIVSVIAQTPNDPLKGLH